MSGCFDIYWPGRSLLPTRSAQGVSVPSGELMPYPPFVATPHGARIAASEGRVRRWEDDDGVYAQVTVNGMAASSFAWVRRDVETGFPPVLFLGRGGQDACIGPSEEPVVAKPPFTPGQVPTATPTRTH